MDNLPDIIADGQLLSDVVMTQRGGPSSAIGMTNIKGRRLTILVDCVPGTRVGEYVPFYFCSRSIMLYVIHRANHGELAYRGGQEPIVHLEADLYDVIDWADGHDRNWAFSLSNAGSYYAQFRSRIESLDEINWTAVAAQDWRAAEFREGKQAEFLIHEFFPWHLVSRVGVKSLAIRSQVNHALSSAAHRPGIAIEPAWYY